MDCRRDLGALSLNERLASLDLDGLGAVDGATPRMGDNVDAAAAHAFAPQRPEVLIEGLPAEDKASSGGDGCAANVSPSSVECAPNGDDEYDPAGVTDAPPGSGHVLANT